MQRRTILLRANEQHYPIKKKYITNVIKEADGINFYFYFRQSILHTQYNCQLNACNIAQLKTMIIEYVKA